MDLRQFTATPMNMYDSTGGMTPRAPNGSAFSSNNNTINPNLASSNNNRMVPPRSPAMSTTSTSSFSNYSTNQYSGNSVNNTPSTQNFANSTNNNPRSQNQQRLFQNSNSQNSGIKNDNSSTNTLSPSLPVGINPLNVNNWMDQQPKTLIVPSRSGTPVNGNNDEKNSNLGILNSANPSTTNLSKKDELEEEVIPTAIVIKNIPFSIKKEQLLEEMTKLNLPLPYAFNYHFDNGVFRGLAFANFTSTDETAMVVNNLNSKEIGGRKLRVEYKKMLPLVERERIEREKREKRGQLEEQHRSASTTSLASLISNGKLPTPANGINVIGSTPVANVDMEKRFFATLPNLVNLTMLPSSVDFNNPEVLDLYSSLLLFKQDVHKKYEDMAYPLTMANNLKKYLNVLCNYLNLVESYENGYIIIKRKFNAPPLQSPNNANSSVINNNSNGQQQILHNNLIASNQRFRGNATPHQPQPRVAQGQNFNLLNNTSPNNIGNNSKNNSGTNNATLGSNSTVGQNSNANNSMLRGTRSYADVRNTNFALPNMYGNNTNPPSISSPTYLNISQPPTPGIEVNSKFGGNIVKSPYLQNNNSSTFLNQSQNFNQNSQAAPNPQANPHYYNTNNNPGNNNNNNNNPLGVNNNEVLNPPSHGLYSNFNNSNPNFMSGNHSMLSLTQNLTGGDTFTTTLNNNASSNAFNNFDDINSLNAFGNHIRSSNNNTPTSANMPQASFNNQLNNGIKSSAASIASNSPNMNNNSNTLSNSNSGKNLISSLNDGLGSLNLNVSNGGSRRDIWGSKPSMI